MNLPAGITQVSLDDWIVFSIITEGTFLLVLTFSFFGFLHEGSRSVQLFLGFASDGGLVGFFQESLRDWRSGLHS